MPSLESIIESYGVLAVFVGTFLEGETILVLAGLAAHRGYLPLSSVMLAGFLGSFVGDQLYFRLGRWRGESILARHPGWAGNVARVHGFLERWELAFMLLFRFFYGLRTVSPFVIGMSRIGALRYTVVNVMGGAIWTLVVALLGYSLGQGADLILERSRQVEGFLFGGVLLAGATAWLVYFVRRRREST